MPEYAFLNRKTCAQFNTLIYVSPLRQRPDRVDIILFAPYKLSIIAIKQTIQANTPPRLWRWGRN